MIDGVKIIEKRKIVDERGAIFHMLRKDDPEFQEFGEIYFSQVNPGYVKGWHLHSRMTLNYYLVTGSIRFVLFDDRKGSPSFGKFQEIDLTDSVGKLVVVPPFVWNAFVGLGRSPSVVANCATEPHSADEIIRKPIDDPAIGYDWGNAKGW